LYRQFKLAIACALVCALAVTTATGVAAPAAHVKAPKPLPRAAHLVAKPKHSYRISIAAERARLEQEQAKEKRAKVAAQSEDFGLAGGVSQATLDAIAACESGGDPTVVDASGTYYGKYQFDMGTWARMGGSGSPAEASEAEQDYRASLLYSQAGSSPWPVCGV
jgi:hypothetical protein